MTIAGADPGAGSMCAPGGTILLAASQSEGGRFWRAEVPSGEAMPVDLWS